MAVTSAQTRTEIAARARRSTLVGIACNGSLAIMKAAAGILGNSYALVADAIESSTDVISSMVVWAGLKVAAEPPNERHPYGKGRAETIAALVVSLTLLAAAITIARQSINEIRTPHHMPAAFTLAVLVLVVVIKETLFRFVFRVGEDVASSAVKTDAWHHRSDAITSAAAFVGISVALIGGKGYESADDWAALLASAIIAFNAWNLLVPALRELTDASPGDELANRIREIAMTVPNVRATHRCWVRKLGFDHYVDLDVLIDGDTKVREGHAIAHQVQDAIRQAIPSITKVLVHVEPDDEAERNRPLFTS